MAKIIRLPLNMAISKYLFLALLQTGSIYPPEKSSAWHYGFQAWAHSVTTQLAWYVDFSTSLICYCLGKYAT